MDYQKHYDKLIETRRNRGLKDGEYYEKHHIVMKSMGGTNDPSNMINLTAREHFLAHWLLWRIHRNRQTSYAFSTFTTMFSGKKHKNRPKITSSRAYAEAREVYSKMHSENMKGKLNSNRSKPVIQMDNFGNFIKEWPSAKEAYRELKISHITPCCRGERSHAGEFTWKYKSGIVKKSKPYKKRSSNNIKNRRPVIQYDMKGNKIKEYSSLSAAQQETGIPRTTIQSNIVGVLKHAGNYIWKDLSPVQSQNKSQNG